VLFNLERYAALGIADPAVRAYVDAVDRARRHGAGGGVR
jgi:hypothetical protein